MDVVSKHQYAQIQRNRENCSFFYKDMRHNQKIVIRQAWWLTYNPKHLEVLSQKNQKFLGRGAHSLDLCSG